MNVEQLNSKTIEKMQKYTANKNGAVSGIAQLINEKNSKLSALESQLEQEEENYLVDFDAAIRQKITDIKSEIESVGKELKEDLLFQEKAQKTILTLKKGDYDELKTAFDKAKAKQDKLYQEVLKKKGELISAFLKFNEEYAEVAELHEELEWAVEGSLGEEEWRLNVKQLLNILPKANVMEQGDELKALFYSAPFFQYKGGTIVKALTGFSGRIDMKKGEHKSIKDKALTEDLIQGGLVEKVKY